MSSASPDLDIPLDIRSNRAEQEARKFIAEQHKLMREAEKLRAEEQKIWRDWRMMPWVLILSMLSALIGGLIAKHL